MMICIKRILTLGKVHINHDDGFYHYDTPLTVPHETETLLEAGFSEVEILNNWGHTYTLRAH